MEGDDCDAANPFVATGTMTNPIDKTIGWALAQTARLHRFYLNEKLADLGLFAGQEQVLQVLDHEDKITMGELAAILRVRNPTVSKAVMRLASLGFVERYPDAKDRRTVRVKLTRTGKIAAERVRSLWDEVEADLIGELDPKQRKSLRKLLLRGAKNLTRALGGDERDFDIPHDRLDDHQVEAAELHGKHVA